MPISKLTVTSPGAVPKEGETLPFRHPMSENELIVTHDPSVTTIYENFHRSVKHFGGNDFLGARKFDESLGQMGPFEFESYAKVSERIVNVAAALKAINIPEKTCIGLYSVNRPEWVIAEHACYANNFINVPLYDTLGEESIIHIFSQTEMEFVFASADKIRHLIQLKDRIASLSIIISMDENLEEGLVELARAQQVQIMLMRDLEPEGEKVAKDFKPTPPKDTDLATICYTSGTTGLPKGAMITHRSLLAAASAGIALIGFPANDTIEPLAKLDVGEESYLSYLPLAHIMERVIHIMLVAIGAKIGFYQGDLLKLMDDLAALRPTIFASVPRLYNRIYSKVYEGLKTKGFLAQILFKYAYASKLSALRDTGTTKHWLWDRIFGAIREKLGGRVKLMITGAAPIAPNVHDFLRVVFSCNVYEGYGMTESCAMATISAPHDMTPKQVGIPAPCVEIKLVDIPEMGYTSKDLPRARGELWVRGPACFSGYYKAEDKTAEALTSDGWVVSGDVMELDEEGRIYLIDRKKSLVKLAQGEYVAPEKVEAILATQPLVAQAFVEGNSLKSYVVAIVVPDQEAVKVWARRQGIAGKSIAELMQDEKLKKAILKSFRNLGSRGTGVLKGFEIPKAIRLEPELFSVEDNLLTPTFKLKRSIARNKYKAIVEELYAEHGDE